MKSSASFLTGKGPVDFGNGEKEKIIVKVNVLEAAPVDVVGINRKINALERKRGIAESRFFEQVFFVYEFCFCKKLWDWYLAPGDGGNAKCDRRSFERARVAAGSSH